MLKLTSTYPRATRVLEGYKRYVVQQAKSNLTKSGKKASGKLYGSIKGFVSKRMNRALTGRFTGGSTMPSLTFEMNEYGKYVDEGVRGSKSSPIGSRKSPYKFGRGANKNNVPLGPIRKWCRAKGIDPKAAYPIAKSVYENGMERTEFFSKPFERRFKITKALYHRAIADDIANNLANQLQKQMKQRIKGVK